MDEQKLILTRRIEGNLDLYHGFYDHEWARELIKKVSPGKLTSPVENLCLAWKDAANTHRLPWLMITQMEAFVGGFVKEHRPYGMRLIDALKSRLRNELGDSVRNMAKNKITEVLDTIDRQLREKEAEYNITIEPRKYWRMLIEQSEFQSSVAGSQSLAYCALVFGYEWFVVSCFRVLGGDDEERPSGKKFWAEFKRLLGGDPKATYWDDPPVWLAREARNCIVHLGGKAKPEVVAANPNPGLFISLEGVISIQPSDNRALFELLKGKVMQLVDEVQPKLQS